MEYITKTTEMKGYNKMTKKELIERVNILDSLLVKHYAFNSSLGLQEIFENMLDSQEDCDDVYENGIRCFLPFEEIFKKFNEFMDKYGDKNCADNK